ncbi:penicillin-binding protein [Microgenomates group bacterium]|nr:penicillin-binding protein [Microgenomates group bacterium]
MSSLFLPKRLVSWGISVFILIFLGQLIVFTMMDVIADLPNVALLSVAPERATTKIYDRNHYLLYSIYVDENRSNIPLTQMGQNIIGATIASEDRDFYRHDGWSMTGFARATMRILGGQNIQGGSTITQQLVKNRLLDRSKTLDRKLKELILAVAVERTYTKDQIMEMYLNNVSYGGVVYGIEQAAVTYFGKNAKNLSLAQAAYLASITSAPSIYAPFAGNLDRAINKQQEVLRQMLAQELITSQQYEVAINEELRFLPNVTQIKAPHFVMYVRDYLEKMYGEDTVAMGGLEVVTTLDLNLQQSAQIELQQQVYALKSLRVGNGAVLITNPKTGEILTMLGSINYWDDSNDGQTNVCLAQRQPGSSIKPLTYALAFLRGYSPEDKILDAPFKYVDPWSRQVYAPVNYDGEYRGMVSLRQALGSSYNIPAVKLLNELGTSNLIDLAEDMGITTWKERNRYGLSLTLGAGEVMMTDLATAYGVFANLGERVDLNPILEVRNKEAQTIYQNPCALLSDCVGRSQRVLPARIAYQVTDILKDNKARTPGFGSLSVINIAEQEVAVKTGTTNSLRDNWTVGYTTDRLVAVWVGNNDNSPMSRIASGVTGASPIWNKVMRLTLAKQDQVAHKFMVPDGIPVATASSQVRSLAESPRQSTATVSGALLSAL